MSSVQLNTAPHGKIHLCYRLDEIRSSFVDLETLLYLFHISFAGYLNIKIVLVYVYIVHTDIIWVILTPGRACLQDRRQNRSRLGSCSGFMFMPCSGFLPFWVLSIHLFDSRILRSSICESLRSLAHSNCVNFFTLTMQAALRAVLKQGEIVCLFIYLFIFLFIV